MSGIGGDDSSTPAVEGAGTDRHAESTLTVVIAGLANLVIAVAKAIGATLSGSAAMMSEAAHSVADTATEVLLFVALRRGARPPDPRHPLGHGRETYLWSLLAALATFVAGGGVAISHGVGELRSQHRPGSDTVALVVLLVAFCMEGVSMLRGLRQLRGNARRWRVRPLVYLRMMSDTPLKAVTFEDAAALVGLVLAAAGIGAEHLTGDPAWDGAASIAIGVLLVTVAAVLVRDNSQLLLGGTRDPALEPQLRADLERMPEVSAVPLLVTSVLGPERLLVAAKVQFRHDLSTGDIERVADATERAFRRRHPGITEVFLDPTPGAPARSPGGPRVRRAR